MKKKIWSMVLCIVMIVPFLTMTARADCAPKPTTNVQVTDTRGRQIIVTLLGDRRQYGPNNVVKESDPLPGELSEEEKAAWAAFRDYADPQGFVFWGQMDWHCMDWRYYPPEVFKVAVYYPGTDTLVVSEGSFERYAFHSDFKLWLEVDPQAHETMTVPMEMKKDVDWMEEVFGFLCRVALTLAVEVAVALVFGYRGKQAAKTILLVNLVTQVGLNALLSVWYIFSGPLDAMLRLVVAELVVLGVEGYLYARRLTTEGKGKGLAVAYAVAANLASVVVGWNMLD